VKFIAWFSLVLIIVAIAMPALAANPEPQLPKETPANTVPVPGVPAANDTDQPQDPAKVIDVLGTSSPMMNEIKTTMDISRGEIAELLVSISASSDFSAKQAAQDQIATIKIQVELDILAIQARYARSAGNEELALQIDAAIEAITSPPAPVAPVENRPAPENRN